MGIVVRAARDGSWADVRHYSSLQMRQEGYPPEACRMTRRIQGTRLQLFWEAPRVPR